MKGAVSPRRCTHRKVFILRKPTDEDFSMCTSWTSGQHLYIPGWFVITIDSLGHYDCQGGMWCTTYKEFMEVFSLWSERAVLCRSAHEKRFTMIKITCHVHSVLPQGQQHTLTDKHLRINRHSLSITSRPHNVIPYLFMSHGAHRGLQTVHFHSSCPRLDGQRNWLAVYGIVLWFRVQSHTQESQTNTFSWSNSRRIANKHT